MSQPESLGNLRNYSDCETLAYKQGLSAYDENYLIGECPYCPGLQRDLNEAWTDGWLDAQVGAVL